MTWLDVVRLVKEEPPEKHVFKWMGIGRLEKEDPPENICSY